MIERFNFEQLSRFDDVARRLDVSIAGCWIAAGMIMHQCDMKVVEVIVRDEGKPSSDEPAVPSAVAHRHRRDRQRSGRKLSRQHTFTARCEVFREENSRPPASGGLRVRLDDMSNLSELPLGTVKIKRAKGADRLKPKGNAVGCSLCMLGARGQHDRRCVGRD